MKSIEKRITIVKNKIKEKYSRKNPSLSIKKQILPKKVNESIGYNTIFNRKGSTLIFLWILLSDTKILNKQEPGINALPIRKMIPLRYPKKEI
ncbi:MAG: hypothetical protein P8Y23_07900 [Candidatus Lokiarchaeota archaeon]